MSAATVNSTSREFLRNLNILLKFSRLYGTEHSRSAAQFDAAWIELQNALAVAGGAGLLLGVSGTKLVLDGVPLEATHAELSFAKLLATAGVASICFERSLTREQFANFIRVFSSGGLAANLGDQLKAVLAQGRLAGIRVNEVRFVAEDSATAKTYQAAQIAVQTLGGDADKLQDILRDPQKLIRLIAAGEGSRRGAGAPHGVSSSDLTEDGVDSSAPPLRDVPESEMVGILHLLVRLGEASNGQSKAGANQVQESVGKLPDAARRTLQQALASVAGSKGSRPGEQMLVRLAEDLAIRFALDRYERGEVRVNAVRQTLERMGSEIESLRSILRSREENPAEAGMAVEASADGLDQLFWASVPESGKRSVLLSPEAWCIPPRNVRQFVEELFARGDTDSAAKILRQYAACLHEQDLQARSKAASGLVQLAELYSRAGAATLEAALREVGTQMKLEPITTGETQAEIQPMLAAAFTRFAQEAAPLHLYGPLERAIDLLAEVEKLRPNWALGIRRRLGLESRCGEFIEEALSATTATPVELLALLKRMPDAASELLAARLPRCVLAAEREHVVSLAQVLGKACVEHLRNVLRAQPTSKATATVGLLSRLDPATVEESLAGLLPHWNRTFQDSVLRQIAVAGSPSRGRLLIGLLSKFDLLLQPLVVDEIGLSGDAEAVAGLLRLAEDETATRIAEYLCVKAIEALGRLGSAEAITPLKRIAETKRAWRWAYPNELRMCAARALDSLDPAWVRNFLPASGLDAAALATGPRDFSLQVTPVRMRRYPRVRPAKPTAAQICGARGKTTVELKAFGLGGGVLYGEHDLAPGSDAILKIPQAFWSVTAQVIFRQTRSLHTVFEIVGIDLEERAKLRRLMVALSAESVPSRSAFELRTQ